MEILGSKWVIVFLGVVALLAILYLIGRKSAHAEIRIDASVEEVWSVLVDIPRVKDWNSVLIPIDGELTNGSTIKYEFYQEEGGDVAVMDAKVKQVTDRMLINQGGGMSGILTFDHQYILKEVGGQTQVTIHEEYRGIMVPFWNPEPVERAYELLLEELNMRVITLKQPAN